MRAAGTRAASALWALTGALLFARAAPAQFGTAASGRYYRLEPPNSADRLFSSVRIDRVAPGHLAMPAPIEAVPTHVQLRALTGQILELPEAQRLYFTGIDAFGAVRLFELDLISRQAREVSPPGPIGPAYGLRLLAVADGSKLYVQWFASGALPETDIYDGVTLRWLGRTSEFRPDTRAVGFEHRAPWIWTFDDANHLVLVDSHSDRIVHTFSREGWFGPGRGEITDAWRDLILVRLDAGHDRYHVVDAISGEIGPGLDLADYRRAEPRLAAEGRLLVLVNAEPRPRSRYIGVETAVATGSGEIYDLRVGAKVAEFQLFVPPELPVSALGTESDPSLPGRLWVFAPHSREHFDREMPSCRGKAPRSDQIVAEVEVFWDPGEDARRYRYGLRVSPHSETAAGALAIRTDRSTVRARAPSGWGVDRIKGDRWVRWTNGLGPPEDDIAPGEQVSGFRFEAREDAHPGIAEYRIQAAHGLPRGCESDDRFLANSASGHTIAPERIETSDPKKLARRLEQLVVRACELDWIGKADCQALQQAAAVIVADETNRNAAIRRFEDGLVRTPVERVLSLTLADAASAVRDAISPKRSP